MQKKILMLGGSTQQIPAIQYAKKIGLYVILCDYLIDNPGQHYVDKFYNVSTTDVDIIYEISKNESIDGIVAYASDPAAPTAAYVSERLGLPGNPYNSVKILANKDLFRFFLSEHNFNTPYAKDFTSKDELLRSLDEFSFPVIVKPVDSSGSKGISVANNINEIEKAYDDAISFTRSNKIIVEEFIEKDHKYLIGGDCFVVNGKVAFWGLLNCHRNLNVNSLVPVGKSYPAKINNDRFKIIEEDLNRLFELLEIKHGAFNLELIFDNKGRLFIIEAGPRNGGNMIPDLLKIATGIDLVEATIETAIGNPNYVIPEVKDTCYCSSYNIHSSKNGILQDISFNDNIKDNIIREVTYKKVGDSIEYFTSSNKALGIIFLKFSEFEPMLENMDSSENLYKLTVL